MAATAAAAMPAARARTVAADIPLPPPPSGLPQTDTTGNPSTATRKPTARAGLENIILHRAILCPYHGMEIVWGA